MRKLSVLLTCLVCGPLFWLQAAAQEPNAGVIFFQHRQFKIPFKNDPKSVNITQVRLYSSTDQGRSWQISGTAAPDEQLFRFSAPQDGFYWFATQSVEAQGKLFPASMEDLRPNLKVIVDTVPPSVQAQPLPPRGGEVGVTWNIRDENLDVTLPDAVQLQYRLAGSVTWIPLAITPGSDRHYWNPQTNASVEARVSARDRAGNVGEDKVTVSLSGAAGASPGFNNPIANRPNDPPTFPKDIERKYVNNKQVSLSYELKDVGPSGVSSVELWYTFYNARAWHLLKEFPLDSKNGAEGDLTKKLVFEIQEEGVYGITLVAKSGVGLGDRPPQVGDRPQFWIEVDLTKPLVQILGATVGSGPEKGKLTITWEARDKNLGATPIRLSYAEQKDGPWTPIAEKLANSGRHVWTMPGQELPYQFYLRAEASDLAGNIGEAITPEKVKVDLSVPKAKIRDIEAGSR